MIKKWRYLDTIGYGDTRGVQTLEEAVVKAEELKSCLINDFKMYVLVEDEYRILLRSKPDFDINIYIVKEVDDDDEFKRYYIMCDIRFDAEMEPVVANTYSDMLSKYLNDDVIVSEVCGLRSSVF